MYCPKCNQQQTSDEMRFCSRCGFPLAGVAQLLANNGMPAWPVKDGKTGTSRGKIIKESASLTLVSWAVAFVGFSFANVGGPIELVARLAAILFFILGLVGLIRFTYGFLFAKDSAQTALQVESNERLISRQAERPRLPPQQSLPVSDYPRRVNTKEMMPQPSVTENTTRLLDDQINNRGE